MIDRDLILKKISKIEDKLLVSKLLDKAEKCKKTGVVCYSDFLDPYQRNITEKALSTSKEVSYTFEGGYFGAERVVVIFCPNDIFLDNLNSSEIPLKVLGVNLNSSKQNLTHRDYLGAVMSLGIRREKIGDILVRDDGCNIFVLNEIADYIKYNLTKIGNAKVTVELKNINDIQIPEVRLKEIKTTVASLRLDSISGAGFGISRSKAAELIKAEKVSINWDITDNTAKQIKEGDTISIRGKGRIVVQNIDGITKKGRINIVLKKLI